MRKRLIVIVILGLLVVVVGLVMDKDQVESRTTGDKMTMEMAITRAAMVGILLVQEAMVQTEETK